MTDYNNEMMIIMFIFVFAIISLYFYNQETFNNTYGLKCINCMEFNQMATDIAEIIYEDIIEYANVCSEMNGDDGPEPSQMTLQCMEPRSIQQEIIEDIAEYIIDYVQKNYGIVLDTYKVIGDFIVNLGLLEYLINPLCNSKLYTIHGLQYFTKNMLIKKIINDLKIHDTLYKILTRGKLCVNIKLTDQ